MKNPNGYGSISYLGKKRRRPYMVRVVTNRHYDKKTDKVILDRTVLGYYATRKEAMIALAKYNEDPYDIKPNTVTFKEIYERWSEKGLAGLGKSSHMSYAAAFKNTAPLHDMPIAKIKTDDMQNIIDNLSGKSESTVNNVVIVFHKVFNYAIQRDIVSKDYSKYVVTKRDVNNKSEIHTPFSKDEILTLWNNLDRVIPYQHSKTTTYNTPAEWLLILTYTGMRPGEFISMKRENVHLDEHYMIGGIKTKQSKNRIIPIHNDIYELIKKYYVSSNGGYLLMDTDKDPFTSQVFRKIVKQFCDELNMIHLPHDGRHTFATVAKRCKMDEFYIQEIMGHAHTGTTNKVYTHVEPEELIAEVNKIKFI